MNRLLPRPVDNTFRGPRIALWVFGALVAIRLIMSVNSILNTRSIVTTADGIPLDTFPPAAARTVLSLFALLALSNLMIVLVCVLVLVRYRALVPFMFALLLLHQLAARLLLRTMPIERAGSPPASVIQLVLLTLTVVGLALSLWTRRSPD